VTTTDYPPFPHPETGELLETQGEFQAAVAAIEARMAPFYRLRRVIREEMIRRFEPILPERRRRTDKQELVARCPRCQGDIKLEDEEASDG
jgi:hypothetical protein